MRRIVSANPATDVLQGSIGYHLFRLHHAMHAQLEARLERLGVTPAQWALLAILGQQAKTPAQIARDMGIDRAAVLRTSARLVERRLVTKTAKPGFRRSFTLALTRSGQNLLPKLIRESGAINAEFCSELSDSERRQLLSLLKRMHSQS